MRLRAVTISDQSLPSASTLRVPCPASRSRPMGTDWKQISDLWTCNPSPFLDLFFFLEARLSSDVNEVCG